MEIFLLIMSFLLFMMYILLENSEKLFITYNKFIKTLTDMIIF